MMTLGVLKVIWQAGGSECKESACNAGDGGSIPGSGRSPAGGHGNPLQYSCLESPMDRGAWRATVHRVAKSQTGLSDFHGMGGLFEGEWLSCFAIHLKSSQHCELAKP